MWKTILGWLGLGGETPAAPDADASPGEGASGSESSEPSSPVQSEDGPKPIGDAQPLDVDLELPPPLSELTTEIPHDADVEDAERPAEAEAEAEAEEAVDPDSLDGDALITAFLDEVESADSGFDPAFPGPVGASIEARDAATRAEIAVRALEHTAIEKQWARARIAVTLANHLLEQPLVLDEDQLLRFVDVFPRARPPGRLLVSAFQRGTPTTGAIRRALEAIDELGGTRGEEHCAHLRDLLKDHEESDASDEPKDAVNSDAKLDVPDFGLDESGVREVSIAGYTARLCAHPPRIEWLGKKGQVRKTLPKVVKRDAPEELAALEEQLARLESVRAEQLDALEALLESDAPLSPDDVRARLDHPITGQMVRRLLWITAEGTVLQTGSEGVSEPVRLWHPRHSDAETVSEWRDQLFEVGIRQPFPQAWLDPGATGDSRVDLVRRVLASTDLDASVKPPWVVVDDGRVDLHTGEVDGGSPRVSKKARNAADAVFVPHDRDPALQDLLARLFALTL